MPEWAQIASKNFSLRNSIKRIMTLQTDSVTESEGSFHCPLQDIDKPNLIRTYLNTRLEILRER